MLIILLAALRKLFRSSTPKASWIFILGAFLRIAFFFLAENNGGDALARAALTAEWLRHPSFQLNFEPWLPFHFWLMGGLAWLVRDPELGARLLSLILGIVSLALLWALAKIIYGESAATLALLVFSLYSLHIGYSTTSSSEAPYLFFLLGGLLGFFSYRASGLFLHLSLGAISLGISAGIRYEAWICIFALFLMLFFFPSRHLSRGFLQSGHVREVLQFGALAGAWPLFWMIYQWRVFERPLYGITMNYSWVAQQIQAEHHSLLYNLALPPGVILVTLTPFLVAAGLYGVVLGFHQSMGRQFALVLLLIGLVLAYQIISGGLLPMARYTITMGTLLAIASGNGLKLVSSLLPHNREVQFRVAIALLLTLNLGTILALSEIPWRFNDKVAAISPRLRFPDRIEGLRQYLKPQLKQNEAIAIDDFNTESNIIASAVGLPLLTRDNAFLASVRPLSELRDFLMSRQPLYVIYSDKGVFRNAFPLPLNCGTSVTALGGMRFKCLYENEIYRVYLVSSAEADGKTISIARISSN